MITHANQGEWLSTLLLPKLLIQASRQNVFAALRMSTRKNIFVPGSFILKTKSPLDFVNENYLSPQLT